MKILLLSDSNSPHTLKWAKSLSKNNFSICIFTIHEPNIELFDDNSAIKIVSINARRELQSKKETSISKLIYIKAIKKVKSIINDFKPDIVHAHYASSYGLIGALSGFHPYILSVWGSDIFQFPTYSFLYKAILKYSIYRADKILATSRVLKEETRKYTTKDIVITPFGIDTDRFSPKKVDNLFSQEDIVIGTIKTLKKNYGIDYLIRAISIVRNKLPHIPIKLLIVGKGPQLGELQNLVKDLNIDTITHFAGYIEHSKIHEYHNMIDIFVAVSHQESFGVSVLEANACAKPVVVSNAGGFLEIVENERTGLIVEKANVEKLSEALLLLVENSNLRKKYGEKGRQKVLNEYSWELSLRNMMDIYNSF